ncbi:PRC-barrel domain containing protein [Thioclava sp. BHET1]|nr:PRC-barrel domain containing protein [Thioclava sp. BHET1]
MKKLVTTTAIGLMLALPVSAETQTNADATASTGSMSTSASAGMSSDMFMQSGPAGTDSMTASDLIGKRVYASKDAVSADTPVKAAADSWDDIGEVSDLVLSADGQVEAVLIDVGGFLGIGEKTVAIKKSALVMVPDSDQPDDYFVVVKGDKSMLDNAPSYNGKADAKGMDSSDASQSGMNATDTASQNASAAMDNAGDSAAATASAAGNAMDNAGDKTKEMASDAGDKTKEMATDAAQQTKQAASDTGNAVKNAADDAGEATKNAAQATGSAIDNAVDSTAAAVGQAGQADQENGMKVELSSVDPDVLNGEGVYGPNNDKVGDISKLVQSADGKVEGVVIDVGGFLGLGAKPVEIKADALTVFKNDTSITVHTNQTEEQLKSMPAYKDAQ